MKRSTWLRFAGASAVAGAALLAGCKGEPVNDPVSSDDVDPKVRRIAEARLSPTEGNTAEGVVTFVQESEGIRVIADIRNLSVNGRHGFHIHETGDCSAPDASSAGGHFNPNNETHAGPMADKRHVGDLGNLETTEAGSAMYVRVDEHLRFDGPASIIGKAVVVHANADDYQSQPSGNAGPRIACGVIEWVEKPEGE
ncbi:superoxide dismutase family protein [Pelagicoccus sp. SDUM812005]|uniref:superoxide dismutase family protein n=1 Tax=Pelagicoccus sp. SDUM812005 TaxID=3041257 RepID=UPI00280D0CB5|nr:superoxide dismutase family protein [Pelagicoccus sp. SDUM812005]MDQ8181096.1 superoxide dismutase family protein [Pelagicoccus sp. SDUM812005]